MNPESKNFLQFNGQNINVLAKDGITYVAIKPICTALGVDYKQQHKNLQDDPILSGVSCKHTTHDTTNRLQEMVCLPEKYIYGWLFSINSKSEDLLKYKKECYDVLFAHFHGATTERIKILREKSADEIRVDALKKEIELELIQMPARQELFEVQARIKGHNAALIASDEKLKQGQFKIF